MNLPRDTVPSTPLGVCLASDWQPHSQGNREEEGCHLDLPCRPWPSEGSFGVWPVFQREWQWSRRAWRCCGLHWHLCFQKCLWPRLHGDSWVRIREERGGQSGQGHPWARKPPGVAVGRGCPAGEASTQSGRSTFCPRASNDCVWAFFLTPPSPSLGQAHWARTWVSLTWPLQPLVLGASGLL